MIIAIGIKRPSCNVIEEKGLNHDLSFTAERCGLGSNRANGRGLHPSQVESQSA